MGIRGQMTIGEFYAGTNRFPKSEANTSPTWDADVLTRWK